MNTYKRMKWYETFGYALVIGSFNLLAFESNNIWVQIMGSGMIGAGFLYAMYNHIVDKHNRGEQEHE